VLTVLALGNRVVLRFLFRLVSQYGNPEIFTASALLIVIGAGLVAGSVGLHGSRRLHRRHPGWRTRTTATSSRRTIEPFKGLLLGLFFMAVACP